MKTKSLPKILKVLTTISLGFGSLVMIFWVGFVLLAGFGIFEGLDNSSVWTRVSWPTYFNIDPEVYTLQSDLMGDGEVMLSQGSVQFDAVNFGSAGIGIEIAIWLLLTGVPVLAILLNLHRIFDTMQEGTPFVGSNVRRIRWIGGLLIFFAIFAEIGQARIAERLFWGVQGDGIQIVHRFQFNTSLILVGLIIFALAEVFRYGLELQTEADLTV